VFDKNVLKKVLKISSKIFFNTCFSVSLFKRMFKKICSKSLFLNVRQGKICSNIPVVSLIAINSFVINKIYYNTKLFSNKI